MDVVVEWLWVGVLEVTEPCDAHLPAGKPGLNHLLVIVGFSRAGRESKPQRVSAFPFSPCITFPDVFLAKASYMVKPRFKGYKIESIFYWEEWHSHIAKGHACGDERSVWSLVRWRKRWSDEKNKLSKFYSYKSFPLHWVVIFWGKMKAVLQRSTDTGCWEWKHTGNRKWKRDLRGWWVEHSQHLLPELLEIWNLLSSQ